MNHLWPLLSEAELDTACQGCGWHGIARADGRSWCDICWTKETA